MGYYPPLGPGGIPIGHHAYHQPAPQRERHHHSSYKQFNMPVTPSNFRHQVIEKQLLDNLASQGTLEPKNRKSSGDKDEKEKSDSKTKGIAGQK